MRKKLIIALFIGLIGLLLTACTQLDDEDGDLYNKIRNQTTNITENALDEKTDLATKSTETLLMISDKLKLVAPFVIIISIVTGIFLNHLISNDVGLRQKFIKIFYVYIPLLMILLTYGAAWLYTVFL